MGRGCWGIVVHTSLVAEQGNLQLRLRHRLVRSCLHRRRVQRRLVDLAVGAARVQRGHLRRNRQALRQRREDEAPQVLVQHEVVHPHRAVLARRRHPARRRAERKRGDTQRVQRAGVVRADLGGGGQRHVHDVREAPALDGGVLAAAHDVSAVGREGHGGHSLVVAVPDAEQRARGHTPQVELAADAAANEVDAVGCDVDAEHLLRHAATETGVRLAEIVYGAVRLVGVHADHGVVPVRVGDALRAGPHLLEGVQGLAVQHVPDEAQFVAGAAAYAGLDARHASLVCVGGMPAERVVPCVVGWLVGWSGCVFSVYGWLSGKEAG